jgi:hypothetical protein
MGGRTTESVVASFLAEHVRRSGRTLGDIATDAELRPAMLKMILAGSTRLPLDHIERLARALGFDAVDLLRVVLRQSMA